MSRSTRIKAAVVALVAAVALTPAAALAAQPLEQYHDRYTESFSDVACGIPVDVRVAATNNFFVLAGDAIKGTGSFRATATNPANGRSVVLSSAGQFSDVAPVVDEAAGTITFHPTYKGLPGKLQTMGGVLALDAGLIAFADTFDLDTGEFLSGEITVDHGPHPQAEAGFPDPCEIIVPALT